MGLEVDDFDEAYIASSRALAVTGTHLSQPRRARRRAGVSLGARQRHAHRSSTSTIGRCSGNSSVPAQGESRFVAAAQVTRALQGVLPLATWSSAPKRRSSSPAARDSLHAALTAIRARTPRRSSSSAARPAAPCSTARSRRGRSAQGLQIAGHFRVEVLNVLGAGDAFLSGLLYGWLNGSGLEALRRLRQRVRRARRQPARLHAGDAESRRARRLHGAHAAATRPDLDDRLEHAASRDARCRRERGELYVLAFDHRRQLEQTGGRRRRAASRRSQRLQGDLIAEAVECWSPAAARGRPARRDRR